MKVPAMQETDREGNAGEIRSVKLVQRPRIFRRRPRSKIAKPNRSSARDNGDVFIVPSMEIHAPKDIELRVNNAPLNRLDAGAPVFLKHLRKATTSVMVHS